MLRLACKRLVLFSAVAVLTCTAPEAGAVDWPEPTAESRPWTRWWWHGSAVDGANLTRLLEEYHRVGLGGVEITCIYGVKGEPHPNRQYRSPEWRDAIRHTVTEATRLGMGVDLPAGSGWRMGDPDLPMSLANSQLVLAQVEEGADGFVYEFGDKATPLAVVARSESGETLDLTDQLDKGRLAWRPPSSGWRVDAAGYRWSGDRVKRPAPGGAGLNINPYWRKSVSDFLTRFAESLDGIDGLRAQFHDSFEYEGNWQPEFFDEFAARRGYRLEEHLPDLSGEGDPERVGRVKADYRQTLEDLVREHLVETWVEWSHQHGMLARNQSHGSPANLIDIYAACDIPEIETFGRLVGGDSDPLMLKFASSAAHVAGKRLVSSETATWLDEHFNVTLGQVKQIVDRQTLAGVNHVFYHGTAYSPDDAAWPGWLFYASTQLNPQNPIWRDFDALNAYVTRVQSMMQASKPDSDVLLYWPVSDQRHSPRGLRQDIRVHNSDSWFARRPIGKAAAALHERGTTFDYVSDLWLTKCEANGAQVQAPGGAYSAVLVPRAEHMPLATIEKLAALAHGGSRVIIWGKLPESLPGLQGAADEPRWADLRERFTAAADQLAEHATIGDDLPTLLAEAGVRAESSISEQGLSFTRRSTDDGALYFLCNESDEPFDGTIEPQVEAAGAVLMDPSTGRIGAAPQEPAGVSHRSVRVQLEPRESVLLLMTSEAPTDPAWSYHDPAADPVELTGWSVDFLEGGPKLPEPFESDRPNPWTESDDPAAESFAGSARYTCKFDAPAGATRGRLDLGDVLGSARVVLNGKPVASLIGPTFEVDLEGLEPTGNRLEIEVTGVAANRIRDLDRRGVAWRIFEDINLVNINYRKFDASDWPVRPLGIAGPVTLTPLK